MSKYKHITYNDLIENEINISNELAESNRLKRLELKLKYNIPEFDLEDWGLVDKAWEIKKIHTENCLQMYSID